MGWVTRRQAHAEEKVSCDAVRLGRGGFAEIIMEGAPRVATPSLKVTLWGLVATKGLEVGAQGGDVDVLGRVVLG